MRDDSQETRPPADTPDLPPPDDPADQAGADEAVPDWLLRIRARRAAEDKARRGAARPAAPPSAARQAPPPGPEAPEPENGAASSESEEAAPPRSGEPGPVEADPPAWLQEVEGVVGEAADPDELPWLREVLAAQAAVAGQPGEDSPPPGEPETGEGESPAEAVRQGRLRRRLGRRAGVSPGMLQSMVVVMAAAVLVATIFTFWTPASFLSDEAREGLRPAYATLSAQSPPTPIPTPIWMRRVGIVSGHWGPHPTTGRDDPGAVCPDGLTEREVNRNVAQLVVQALSGRGYDVDLLDEWDPRLEGYQASALLSIHADSCHQFDLPGATGFKVAPPSSRTTARADDQRLTECLLRHYAEITGLPVHPSLTRDMTEYHSFREIADVTPAAIIEIGFLYEDRAMLTEQPDLLAQGIVAGLLCFLEAAPPTPLPELTPWPTAIHTPTPLETPGLS